jgi:hypothetical protein
MLALLIKTQIQDGARWDSVTTVSVAILLIAGVAIILALVTSRIIQKLKLRKTRAGRRHR